jgi:hypothetical protein
MVSKEARRNLEAHIEGERRRDIVALMAPLSASPVYVIRDYEVRGREAVQAMYERVLPQLCDALDARFDEYLREYLLALNDPAVTRWGDDHCVIEYSDAYPLHRNTVLVVHFDGDKVKSENAYYRTSDALAGLPGVRPVA